MLYFIVTNIFTYSQAELSSLRPCPPAPENFENKDFTAESFVPKTPKESPLEYAIETNVTVNHMIIMEKKQTNKKTVFEKFHF